MDDDRAADERTAAAYETLASEYGWSIRHIRRELTDELLVLYLDALVDRIETRLKADRDALVEAVRAGTIFASNAKAYSRWIAKRGGKSAALSAESLEVQVMALGLTHPEYVVVGP